MKKSIWIIIIVVIVLLGIIWWYMQSQSSSPANVAATNGGTVTVSYSCDDSKTITAVYTQGETKPSANPQDPPIPGGSVMISLSDGRQMTLPQTISADGTRYANADESIIFWGKGNGAFMTEGSEQTYSNCVETPASSS